MNKWTNRTPKQTSHLSDPPLSLFRQIGTKTNNPQYPLALSKLQTSLLPERKSSFTPSVQKEKSVAQES
ncbi:uncharacterized protein EAE98_012328 [Botrytis deweyae]|uniref:Uncharacterized protein n=1 Tax=Botrytis deweyae TaxID=2478750 RepID=A0ABQ7I3D8_9HELO|nr:uncharacterized protein EAE98_012328 [Botrytis deweyae]KAF7909116.1 hypothetical protein EAE98_012328 [Botrytis deweyae]